MLGEVLLVIVGSAFWCLIGYGVGHERGHRAGWVRGAEEMLASLRLEEKLTTAASLVEPLACPVCGAGRSNAEISNGWCANCGVYSDGTP